MHLKDLGHSIVNDKSYGGIIQNSGIKDEFDPEDFKNAYQNDDLEDGEGNKMFLILWLHAYKYTYKEFSVKTKKPEWT